MTDPQLEVAQDLRALAEMSQALPEQAAHKANADLPGGRAMEALGPVSWPSDRQRRGELNEADWLRNLDDNDADWCQRCQTLLSTCEHRMNPWADEFDEWVPPLQLLMFWSEDRRLEPIARPTIASEATYLLDNLASIWAEEPHFSDFVRDIRTARRRLEDVLYDGEREERSRVPCVYCTEDSAGQAIKIRLVKRFDSRAEKDHWLCPKCRREYGRDAYAKARESQLESEPADRYVSLYDAVAAIPRPESTVRSWLYRTEVRTAMFGRKVKVAERGKARWICDLKSHRVLVWWPDVRDMHRERTEREQQRVAS